MGLLSTLRKRLRPSEAQADTSSAKDEELEKMQALIRKAGRDLEFWHKTFKAFSVVPCAYCKKQMRVYPYGGAYYTIKDNQKVHAACYDKYLAEDKPATDRDEELAQVQRWITTPTPEPDVTTAAKKSRKSKPVRKNAKGKK